jgi:hypothetical protein
MLQRRIKINLNTISRRLELKVALTSKDLQIINKALAFYQAEVDDLDGNLEAESHKQMFGNPKKTIEATRARVWKEINKRERTCV